MTYVIVGNKGSYYFEAYWQGKGKKFAYDPDKALEFVTHEEAKDELEYVKEHFSHANPLIEVRHVSGSI